MNTLEEDFNRFCHQHSWYKHLPPQGVFYTAQYKQGQQIRHGIRPEVDDDEGWHWHFLAVPYDTEAPPEHCFMMNCFSRGLETNHWNESVSRVRGFHITSSLFPDVKEYIHEEYPLLYADIFDATGKLIASSLTPELITVFETEHCKQLHFLKLAAAQILVDNVAD